MRFHTISIERLYLCRPVAGSLPLRTAKPDFVSETCERRFIHCHFFWQRIPVQGRRAGVGIQSAVRPTVGSERKPYMLSTICCPPPRPAAR
jgi:hypothetical protein